MRSSLCRDFVSFGLGTKSFEVLPPSSPSKNVNIMRRYWLETRRVCSLALKHSATLDATRIQIDRMGGLIGCRDVCDIHQTNGPRRVSFGVSSCALNYCNVFFSFNGGDGSGL